MPWTPDILRVDPPVYLGALLSIVNVTLDTLPVAWLAPDAMGVPHELALAVGVGVGVGVGDALPLGLAVGVGVGVGVAVGLAVGVAVGLGVGLAVWLGKALLLPEIVTVLPSRVIKKNFFPRLFRGSSFWFPMTLVSTMTLLSASFH